MMWTMTRYDTEGISRHILLNSKQITKAEKPIETISFVKCINNT